MSFLFVQAQPGRGQYFWDQVLAGSFAKKFPNARRLGLGIGEDRDGDMSTRVSMMDLLRRFLDH